MSKYHATKTEVNGIVFDSKLEAERFTQLLWLEKGGAIRELKLQPEFQINQGWVNPDTGEKIYSRFYKGDFQYYDTETDRVIVEDVKGVETAEFRLKWDLVRSQYYPQYEFRKVTKDDI